MAPRCNPEQNPTLRGRRLAMELQRRREATGMSREEVARQLEWSTSTLFRIETGRNRPQPGNVRTLLELYGVTGPERDGLIQLTRDARQPGWWHSFRDVLPNPYEVYIGLEAGAASLRNFEPIAGASPPVPSCNRQSCCAATSAGSLSDDPGSTWRPRLYTGTARVD
jgi:transcriptional regulator with XRE-family HTH domain